MAIRILELSSDTVSLEFDEVDIPAVRAAIVERFGKIEQSQHIVYVSVYFGSAEFIFQNEWGFPCLISTSPEGSAHLRDICAELTLL